MADLISLREAIALGVIPIPEGSTPTATYNAVRKARERGRRPFPPAASILGRTPLYDPATLRAWAATSTRRGRRALVLPAELTAPPAPVAELGADGGEGGEGAAGLAAWWDRIAAERARATPAEARGVREVADPADGGAPCPQCGAPMRWAGGYTALICARHRPAMWQRDGGARGRAERHAERVTPRQAGPTLSEQRAAAAEAAVIADDIGGAREVLALIPRGHPWRAEAVRARHRLAELAEQCGAARTLAAADAAADAAEALYDEADAVIRQARKIEARQARGRGTGGAGLLRLLRGDYAYDEDNAEDDEGQGAELAEGAPPALPAAPATATPPPCQPCAVAGRVTLAARRVDPFWSNGEQGLDVCGTCGAPFGTSAQVVTYYAAAGGADPWAAWDTTARGAARAIEAAAVVLP